MSLVSGLQTDQVWVPMPNSAYDNTWTEVKLVNTHNFKGVTYWWVEAKSKANFTSLESLTASGIKTNFVRKPAFYQVGKTYKFRNVGRSDTWKILDLYTVNRAAYGDKMKAVAKMVTDSGYEDIQCLTPGDFERMVEVK